MVDDSEFATPALMVHRMGATHWKASSPFAADPEPELVELANKRGRHGNGVATECAIRGLAAPVLLLHVH